MNIALLHYSVPPVVGGVESVLAQQARVLAAAGHAVRLVAARGDQTDPAIPLRRVPLADSRQPEVLRVKAELDAGRVPPAFADLQAQLEAALGAALAGVDALIAHNVCSLNKNLPLTAALRVLHGRPGFPRLILWHHDLAWTAPRYQPELHPGWPWDLLRTAWPGAVQVVISELRRGEWAALTGLAPEAIHVIPNGLDLAALHKLEPQTQALARQLNLWAADPLLLLPVRVTARKNIELAVRVLAELRAGAFPHARLVVTGPLGPHNPANQGYFQELRALRAGLGLEASAHFLAEHVEAWLPDAVIADFYRLADALFLPSREEGFGLPILEAGAARLPIFCADIAPLRTLAGDAAVYFHPAAPPAEVARQVVDRLRTDPIFRLARLVRTAYTWDGIYARYLAPLLLGEAR